MITIAVLVVAALGALYAIASPVLTHMRRPWQFNAPNDKEESLRQEQIMALDALRDLAMDYRMGQLAEEDYRSLAAPLQKRAKQTLETQIGQNISSADASLANLDLDAELETAILSLRAVSSADQPIYNKATPDRTLPAEPLLKSDASVAQFCTQCGEKTEPSFRFCGFCGAPLPLLDSTSETAVDMELTSVESTSLESTSVGSTRVESVETAVPSLSRWWIASAVISAIFIAATIGVYLNSRAGQENQTPVATLPDGPVVTLAATMDQTLASSAGGLYISTELDAWSQLLADELPTDDTFLSITPLKGQAGSWLAADALGLWRTTDDGNSWKQIDLQPTGTNIKLIASAENGILWGANAAALFSSDDQGATWRQIDTVMPGRVQALAIGPTDIFIGSNRGVFRSTDQGASWINSNSIVNGRIGSTNIQALAYDEAGSNLFAGTPQGLYFLNMENVSGWGRRTLNADVRSLAIPDAADNVLWLGTADGKIFRSTDRGVTWRN